MRHVCHQALTQEDVNDHGVKTPAMLPRRFRLTRSRRVRVSPGEDSPFMNRVESRAADRPSKAHSLGNASIFPCVRKK